MLPNLLIKKIVIISLILFICTVGFGLMAAQAYSIENSPTDYLPGGLSSDPKTGVSYAPSVCTTSAYCFCTELEAAGSGNASNGNCSFASSGDYFCVQNLQ